MHWSSPPTDTSFVNQPVPITDHQGFTYGQGVGGVGSDKTSNIRCNYSAVVFFFWRACWVFVWTHGVRYSRVFDVFSRPEPTEGGVHLMAIVIHEVGKYDAPATDGQRQTATVVGLFFPTLFLPERVSMRRECHQNCRCRTAVTCRRHRGASCPTWKKIVLIRSRQLCTRVQFARTPRRL